MGTHLQDERYFRSKPPNHLQWRLPVKQNTRGADPQPYAETVRPAPWRRRAAAAGLEG